jgi:uncharacterized protein (TIGR03663 family)
MTRNRLFAISFLAVLAAGSALRIPRLDLRPMHGDEAVHAVKFGELLERGRYRYDPEEYHGPTLYYSTLPVAWLTGTRRFEGLTETMLRIVPVLFGIATIGLLWFVRDGLGRGAALAAAALAAVSPALVFYSRYYIQESLLVFFTFLAIVAGWRFVRGGRAAWAVLAGIALGMMHATKETSILVFAGLAFGGVAVRILARRDRDARGTRSELSRAGLLAGAAAAVSVSVLLYSAFFREPSGPLDAVRSLRSYAERAVGDGLHDHPPGYYLGLLLHVHYAPGPRWSEALLVGLGGLGAAAALAGRGPARADRGLARFLAFSTLFLVIVYSVLPYKTPWNLLGFVHGLTLLGGMGLAVLVGLLRRPVLRTALLVAFGVGVLNLAAQAHRASFRFPADPRNPWVYAHPTNDAVRMANRVVDLASVHPQGREMRVHVISPDYWPLPWYFRSLRRVGYWDVPPRLPDAAVIVVHRDLAAEVDRRVDREYVRSYHGLRPDVTLVLYVERGLWERYVDVKGLAGKGVRSRSR